MSTTSVQVTIVLCSLSFLIFVKLMLYIIKNKYKRDPEDSMTSHSSSISISEKEIPKSRKPIAKSIHERKLEVKKRPIDAISENNRETGNKRNITKHSDTSDSDSDSLFNIDTISMNSCQLRTKRSQQLFGISAKNNLRRVFVNLEETKDPLETKIKAVAKAKMCEEEDDKFALHIKKQNEILNNPLVDKFSTHIIIDDKEKDKEKEKPIVKLKYKFNDERDTKSEYNALGSGVKHKDSKKKKNTFKYNNINKKADDIFFEMFKTFAGPQKNKKRVKKEAELEKSVRLTSCKSAYGN